MQLIPASQRNEAYADNVARSALQVEYAQIYEPEAIGRPEPISMPQVAFLASPLGRIY